MKTWNKVQEHTDRRTKKYLAKGGACFKRKKVAGLFAYFAKCPHCSSAMNRRRYRPSYESVGPMVHSLVCGRAIASDECEFKPVLYEPLESVFLKDGNDMMRGHLADLEKERDERRTKVDNHEKHLLGARVDAITEIIDAQPLDRNFLIRQLRNLFKRVATNYPKERMEFEWVYGEKSHLTYSDHLRRYAAERYGKFERDAVGSGQNAM